MTAPKSLRERVAQALYESDVTPATPWDGLSRERRIGWLSDADAVIPIVAGVASTVADQRNPEKPSEYLSPRDRIGDAIRGLLVGCEERGE